MTDLNDIVAGLIATSQKAKKAKALLKKRPLVDLSKLTEVEKTQHRISLNARLSDGKWAEEVRVLLLREVLCTQCGMIQTAPNEFLLVRKSHPKHGVHEEAIGVHGQQYHHLPLAKETHQSTTHICQYCCQYDDANRAAHIAQIEFPFMELSAPTPTSTPTLETKKNEGVSILDDLFGDEPLFPESFPTLEH